MAYILEEPMRQSRGQLTPSEEKSSGGYVLESTPKKADSLKLAEEQDGSFLGGIKRGLRDPLEGAAQIISELLPTDFKNKAARVNDALAAATGMGDTIGDTTLNQRIAEGEAGYQQARKEAGREGVDIARIGGNLALTAPLALAPGMQLTAGKGVLDVANMLRGAGQSAIIGGLMPVTENQGDFVGEKVKQIGTSAALGGAAAPAGAAVGRIINPNVSPEVAALQREGVRMTPGQILGGVAQKAEDKLAGIIPGISGARKRGIEDFNRAAYARALEGTGIDAGKLPVGREGVAVVKAAVKRQYEDLLPKMVFKPDQQFNDEVLRVAQMTSGLGQREQTRFLKEINNIMSKTKNGVMLGETYKTIESKLGKDAANFMSSTDAYQREVGAALTSVLQSMKDNLARSNPRYAKELAQANSNFANYARIRKASAGLDDQSGGFTPQQLQAAVKTTDRSKDRFATNTALMQDLSNAGVSRLGSKPASGLEKTILGGGLGTAAVMNPLLIAGGAAAALPYTKLGQQVSEALLTRRPQLTKEMGKGAANALLRVSPLAGASLQDK